MYKLGTAVKHIVCDDVMKVGRKRKNLMEKLTMLKQLSTPSFQTECESSGHLADAVVSKLYPNILLY